LFQVVPLAAIKSPVRNRRSYLFFAAFLAAGFFAAFLAAGFLAAFLAAGFFAAFLVATGRPPLVDRECSS
jgi:hypothetical protein